VAGLQHYLDGEHGLTGAVVRALLNAPHPAVIIGTLWPDRYAAYAAMPAPGGADPHARERQVLDLADVVRIDPTFSEAEQDRARAAATRDPKVAVALEAAGYGLTQTLAAAPQLVARWQDAQTASPYAWAVLTAALDVARLGARAPLSVGFLRAAAPGYCTTQQQAEAPENWFEQALAYATGKLYGAAAALSPAGAGMGGMGQIAGYTVADYLVQHASRERRHMRAPASAWDAVLSHIRDPADAARLAESAKGRLLYRYAIRLYRHASDADDSDTYAASELADLLADRGDLDELRARADAGDGAAAGRLARLLADRGDLDELRARADAGDPDAVSMLARLLADRGDLDELRARADAGDVYAARLLADRGDLDGAAQALRAQADAGDGAAPWWLARLLADRGDLDGAVQVMRPLADAGDPDAAVWLAEWLAECGDLGELRALADAGDVYAARVLALFLADREDLDELRARADAGDGAAAWRLADLLVQRGDLDGAAQILRPLADAGYSYAAWLLARLLADRGDLDGAVQVLRPLADAGDEDATLGLAELLAKRGDLDGAVQVLRPLADAGYSSAAQQLVHLLADRGDLDKLRPLADAGDPDAVSMLARLLADRGDLDGAVQVLRAQADAGYSYAAQQLAELLAEQLIEQDRGEEAERLRRFGLNPDGSTAHE